MAPAPGPRRDDVSGPEEVRPSTARPVGPGQPWTPGRRAAARPREVVREAPDGVVRDATAADAPACAGVYAPYVLGTPATFENEPPDGAETARRIAAAQEHHAWLVLEEAGRVVGFAHGGTYRPRPAYRWACETTVYLEAGATGRGGGRALYEALLGRLAGRGLLTATAVVARPNPASERLHAALGFTQVGVFRRVGWKLGAWHDVAWYQRTLGDGPREGAAPAEPG